MTSPSSGPRRWSAGRQRVPSAVCTAAAAFTVPKILRLRGSCAEAEEEALDACEELRPYLRRELGWPLTELGRIRQQRGDLAGAEEAFLAAHESGWDPQPGLALVYLAQGKVGAAAVAIRAALEHPSSVPSKELPPNTELRRAPLLAAAVDIELAAGDLQRALSAVDELSQIAATFESKALVASATVARARVQLADGQLADARMAFERAVRLWNEVGAPYETALARMGLAEVQRAQGNDQLAELELRAARATLVRVGAESVAQREPPPREEPRQASSIEAFRREGDTWWLAFAGSSVRLRDLKGLRYLARLLAEPGREFHVLELVALEREPPEATSAPPGTSSARRPEGMQERSSMPAPRMPTGGGLPRSRRTSTKPLRWRTSVGSRRLRPNASSWFANCHARSASVAAIAAPAQRRSAPGRASRARCGRHWLAFASTTRHSAVHLDRAVRTGTHCIYLPDI